MGSREERDPLGRRKVPSGVLWGIQTLRAMENFPVSGLRNHEGILRAYAEIKLACAKANRDLGSLEESVAEAIIQATQEILEGKHWENFVVDRFQAGAGTSTNMNVNEVITNRALQLLGEDMGRYDIISPNDHVNMGQSTNDTYPSASQMAAYRLSGELLKVLRELIDTLEKKAEELKDVLKSGRTHLMDAMPVTLGMELKAYALSLRRCSGELERAREGLKELPLGGNAVGTGVNTREGFRERLFEHLREITGVDFRPNPLPLEGLQSTGRMLSLAGAVNHVATELGRIASDLRLLSSGPTTGLAEITLPAVQPGSSIMPGKVNPVMAECLNMVCYHIHGLYQGVLMASGAGQMELNVMIPMIANDTLEMIQLLVNFLPVFRERAIERLEANRERCRAYLERNPSLATLLTPHIGYMKAAELAKESLRTGKPVKDLAVEKGILSREEAERIFSRRNLLGMNGDELEGGR